MKTQILIPRPEIEIHHSDLCSQGSNRELAACQTCIVTTLPRGQRIEIHVEIYCELINYKTKQQHSFNLKYIHIFIKKTMPQWNIKMKNSHKILHLHRTMGEAFL